MLRCTTRWQQHSLDDRGKNHFCLLLFMIFEHLGCFFLPIKIVLRKSDWLQRRACGYANGTFRHSRNLNCSIHFSSNLNYQLFHFLCISTGLQNSLLHIIMSMLKPKMQIPSNGLNKLPLKGALKSETKVKSKLRRSKLLEHEKS